MAWLVESRGWNALSGALMLALGLAGACAQGGGSGGDDDGSGASDAQGVTSNSSAGQGGSGATGGTSSVDASSSSSGTMCDESPCRVVAPQCGCMADEKCSVNGQGMRFCEADGDVPTGDNCGLGQSCVAGDLCINTAGMSMCRRFCDDDSQCPGPGALCALQIGDGNGGVWPEKFCSENCDPVTNTGCGPADSKCELGQEQGGAARFLTLCTKRGTGTQGASCTTTANCAPGFSCFTDPNTNQMSCLGWCSPTNNTNCAGGGTCFSFATPVFVDTVEYGVCQ